MGHFAYRATSPEALQHRVGIIEASGRGKGWTEGDLGHGPAYAFTTPDGHNMEIYYETEWYKAAAGAGARAEEPGAALPGARRQRAPPRPHEPAHVRRGGAADIPGGRGRSAHHREDRARQRQGGGRLGHHQQQELRPGLHARPLRRQGPLPPRHLRARLARGDPARRRHFPGGRRAHRDRGRTSTRSSRRSSSTSTSPAATASRWPTPAHASCWRRTGSPSCGPRPSARRAKPGASRPSRASTPTAPRPSTSTGATDEVTTEFPLPILLQNGERVRVRGGRLFQRCRSAAAPHPDPLPRKSGEREKMQRKGIAHDQHRARR